MSQFTIDVLELAIKQGRAVTKSTMFSLAIAESSLNKRGHELVAACRRRIAPRHTTADFESSYKDLLLMQSSADPKCLQTQEIILENLVAETYELLEKEKEWAETPR